MVLDQVGACFCCEKQVRFSSEVVAKTESPLTVCRSCFSLIKKGSIPMFMLRTMFVQRQQIGYLFGEMAVLKKSVESLYLAQKDVELSLLALT